MQKLAARSARVPFAAAGSTQVSKSSQVIPLGPATEEASEGDILLSWWQTGSGMQRCYVVDASDPTRPLVKYLDIDLDSPTNSDGIGIGSATPQLKAGTFSVLSKATQDFPPGSGAACRERGSWASITYTQIISTSADKLLGLGFAGRVTSYPIEGCVAVPVSASFADGDTVFASDTFLNMREATIVRFDPELGRYYVVFSSDEEPIAIGGLIDNLDSLPSTLSPTISPTYLTPSPTDNPFPLSCLTDREKVENCAATLGANETTCLDCWVTSLPENPDGCNEGRELFCGAFSAACDELCGTCQDPIFALTNCLVEEAQACGFENPLCSDGTTTAPTSAVASVLTPVPTPSPTDTVSFPPSIAVDEELPPECFVGLLGLLGCTESLGEKGEPCFECWTNSLPENPPGCEEGRNEFCTAFDSCDCGICKDQLLTLTNCIVEAGQGCGFENPVCSDAGSGATSIVIGRFIFLAMAAMQFVVTFVL